MNTIVNFVSGHVLSPVWGFLDGKKAYGTGALAVLGALVGLGTEFAPLLATHNTAGIIAIISHINSDPSYLALLGGLGVIAGAHKADKVIAAVGDKAAPQA